MRTFAVSKRWSDRWHGAIAACMIVADVSNPPAAEALDECLASIESEMRSRYAGLNRADLRERAPFEAYHRYYRHFGQNYHVLHQVESVALKHRPIPRRAALVEAAFAEELRSGLLTAMHDADVIGPEVTTDAALGSESVALYNGTTVVLDRDDMYMRDETGVLTSVIKGPAAYGLVTPDTTRVAVCVYAPDGIGVSAVTDHLEAIAANMRLISPAARVELLEVIEAATGDS